MREARTFQGVKIPLRCMAGGSFPRAAFGDTKRPELIEREGRMGWTEAGGSGVGGLMGL